MIFFESAFARYNKMGLVKRAGLGENELIGSNHHREREKTENSSRLPRF